MIEVSIGPEDKFKVEKLSEGILINGKPSDFELVKISDDSYKVFKKNKIYSVEIVSKGEKEITVSVNGELIEMKIQDHIDKLLEKLGMDTSTSSSVKELKAPMPGTILSLKVNNGDEVSKGDPLLILEAMKMENVIKSPSDGKISKISVQEGNNVEKNQILISFE